MLLALKLQEWTNLANIAAGLATVILAAFAIYQIIALRRQVKLTKESLEISRASLEEARASVEVATRSAEITRDAVIESVRARVDQYSPRIVAWTRQPEWPPRLENHLSEISTIGPRILNTIEDRGPLNEQIEFIFPQDEEKLLWFEIFGVVRNEGQSSAVVTLDGETRFIDGGHSFFPDRAIRVPPLTGQYQPQGHGYLGLRHVLAPGEIGVFQWGAGYSLKKWAEQERTGVPLESELRISAFGTTEVGIVDLIRIRLGAKPIVSVPSREGHWKLGKRSETGVSVYRTVREYHNLTYDQEPKPRP